MATIRIKEEIIQAASEEFEGIANHSLIAMVESIGLADWASDYPILCALSKKEELNAVYFMFAHFILLALEEES